MLGESDISLVFTIYYSTSTFKANNYSENSLSVIFYAYSPISDQCCVSYRHHQQMNGLYMNRNAGPKWVKLF